MKIYSFALIASNKLRQLVWGSLVYCACFPSGYSLLYDQVSGTLRNVCLWLPREPFVWLYFPSDCLSTHSAPIFSLPFDKPTAVFAVASQTTDSTVCWLESKNLAHVLAEGPGDVCTDLVWVLNTYLGLLCVKGRISLSNLCSFQTWCSSFWRGRHRNHVLSSLHEARGILLLQSPNSLNVGWPRPLAFQTSPQMYVFRDRSSYTRRSGYCQVLFMFGDGQYVIHKAQTEKMGHVCMALF